MGVKEKEAERRRKQKVFARVVQKCRKDQIKK